MPLLLAALAAGGIYIAKITAGPSPQERLQTFIDEIAPVVLAEYRGEDPNANEKLRAAVSQLQGDTGCEWYGGTGFYAETRGLGERDARALIARTMTALGDQAKQYNIAYSVTPSHNKQTPYLVVVAIIHCAPASPAIPGMGS